MIENKVLHSILIKAGLHPEFVYEHNEHPTIKDAYNVLEHDDFLWGYNYIEVMLIGDDRSMTKELWKKIYHHFRHDQWLQHEADMESGDAEFYGDPENGPSEYDHLR